MAEQEISKHTKAVYKAWNNPHTSWKVKVKETIIEIAIIVFAITLSLWLHNRSEKNHDREEAKIFLEGLKTDLTNDTAQLHEDDAIYKRVIKGVEYFNRVSSGEPLEKDSLKRYEFLFYNHTYFTPNMSRYEALKNSGKLNIIEDKVLLNNIIDYYQQTIPFINMLNVGFNNYKDSRYADYIDEHTVIDKDGSSNVEEVIRMTPVKNALRHSLLAIQAEREYRLAITQAEKLLKDLQEVNK